MKKILILSSLILAFGLSNTVFAQDINPTLADGDCAAAFNISTAAQTCRNASAKVVGDASCNIVASCGEGGNGGHMIPNNITIPYQNVASLSNCSGYLRVGGCSK